MKNQLVIHIGTHKTGTSTIQAQLSECRSVLREKGILYGATDRPPYPQHPKHTSLFRALTVGKAAFELEFTIIMKEFEASGCTTLVLSEEGFSSPAFEKFNYHMFKRFLPHFDIRAVCFFRRQDYFLESLWNQRCKLGKQSDNVEGFLAVPKNRLRLDYLRIINFWMEFTEFKAVGFEAAVRVGLEQAFTDASGIQISTSKKRRNVSPGMHCAATMAILNRMGVEYDVGKLTTAFADDKSKYVLGSTLRQKLLAEFSDHNAKLAESHGVNFPVSLPDEPEDPLRLPDLDAVLEAMATLTSVGLPSRRNFKLDASKFKT